MGKIRIPALAEKALFKWQRVHDLTVSLQPARIIYHMTKLRGSDELSPLGRLTGNK
jgi:hypothetical protein